MSQYDGNLIPSLIEIAEKQRRIDVIDEAFARYLAREIQKEEANGKQLLS